MPIYMDIHQVPGIEALDAAEAHRKDMLIQAEFQCKCMTYWVDVDRGVVFCLIEAPDKSEVEEMHRRSHGLVPNKVIEVKNELVESFLGRIHDPEDAEITDTGLKVFSGTASRILMVTEMTDPALLRCTLGAAKAGDVIDSVKNNFKKALSASGGRTAENAESTGNIHIAAFSSTTRAIACAVEIRKNLPESVRALAGCRIGLHIGEPVAESDKLFGDTIRLARYLCTITSDNGIVISSQVKETLFRDAAEQDQRDFRTLLPQDENLVKALFGVLEANWQDHEFDVPEFCRALAMSKSGLYRKTMAFWNLPPNLLLKDFRLDKARELLKRQSGNISQTTFDSGFNSPSYFTKCFKRRFGLLPAKYLAALA
jgi:AraC-like DNA-binding protein